MPSVTGISGATRSSVWSVTVKSMVPGYRMCFPLFVEAVQLGAVEGEKALAQVLVRKPAVELVDEVGVVRHEFRHARMRPVGAPDAAVGTLGQQRLHERAHVVEVGRRLV